LIDYFITQLAPWRYVENGYLWYRMALIHHALKTIIQDQIIKRNKEMPCAGVYKNKTPAKSG